METSSLFAYLVSGSTPLVCAAPHLLDRGRWASDLYSADDVRGEACRDHRSAPRRVPRFAPRDGEHRLRIVLAGGRESDRRPLCAPFLRRGLGDRAAATRTGGRGGPTRRPADRPALRVGWPQ